MQTTSQTEIARLATLTASERAAERNAKTRAWVAAAPDRCAGLLVEEQAFWADRGIVTGLDLERHLLMGNISDTYKERHGVRPRFFNFAEMTLTEMEKVLEGFYPAEAN